MTTIISREYWFSAAHRIEGHPKCGRLHGHNYKVVVFVTGHPDERGMVIDYGDLDVVVKPIIDALDHRYIVSDQNIAAGDLYADEAIKRDDAVIPHIAASTAEILAYMFSQKIHDELAAVLGHSVVVGVEVHETPKSTAFYE